MANLLDSNKFWKPYTAAADDCHDDDVGQQKPAFDTQHMATSQAMSSVSLLLREQPDSDENSGRRKPDMSAPSPSAAPGLGIKSAIVSSSSESSAPLLNPMDRMEPPRTLAPLGTNSHAHLHHSTPAAAPESPFEYRRLSIKDLTSLSQHPGDGRELSSFESATPSTVLPRPPLPSLSSISTKPLEPMHVDFADDAHRRHSVAAADPHSQQPPWMAAEPPVGHEHLRRHQAHASLARETKGPYSAPTSPRHSPLRRPHSLNPPPSFNAQSDVESYRHMNFMQSPASQYPHSSPDLLGNSRILPDRRRSILMEEAAGGPHMLGRRSSMPLEAMRFRPDTKHGSSTLQDHSTSPPRDSGNHENEYQNSSGYQSASGGEGQTERRGSIYSRSPELRLTHKLAERKRRKEMKDLFDELRDSIPTGRNLKTSKWEILSKAVDYIAYLKRRDRDMEREISSLRHELAMLKHGRGV